MMSHSTLIIRDLTLRSAGTFGTFHLVRLLFEEYLYYLLTKRCAKALGLSPVAFISKQALLANTTKASKRSAEPVEAEDVSTRCSLLQTEEIHPIMVASQTSTLKSIQLSKIEIQTMFQAKRALMTMTGFTEATNPNVLVVLWVFPFFFPL